LNTRRLAGRMMMQMLGAFAEFERGMIWERSMAGQQAAMLRVFTVAALVRSQLMMSRIL